MNQISANTFSVIDCYHAPREEDYMRVAAIGRDGFSVMQAMKAGRGWELAASMRPACYDESIRMYIYKQKIEEQLH